MGDVKITGTTGSRNVDGVTSTSADGATTKSLTLEQSNYISTIMGQLLVSGYDEDFVQEIGSAMEKMYTESFTFGGETFESFNDFLDVKLPETIKSAGGVSYKSAGGVSYANIERRTSNDGTFSENVEYLVKEGMWLAYPSPDAQAVHQMVTDEDSVKLRRILTAARTAYFENHGADFDLIKKWLRAQQSSSWSEKSKEVKALLMQMKKCRPEVHECVYLGPPEAEADLRSKVRLQPPDKLKESLVLEKAFTAIALSKIEAPGVVDTENATIKLRRGLSLSENFRIYAGLQGVAAKDMVGKEFKEKQNGIADSTAFGTPAPAFCFADILGYYPAAVVVEYEMPNSDVHAAFMFEEQLTSMTGPSSELYKWEHEFVCDFFDKKARIIYVDLMKNVDVQEL